MHLLGTELWPQIHMVKLHTPFDNYVIKQTIKMEIRIKYKVIAIKHLSVAHYSVLFALEVWAEYHISAKWTARLQSVKLTNLDNSSFIELLLFLLSSVSVNHSCELQILNGNFQK